MNNKFCISCGLPFNKQWNKSLEAAYMTKEVCSKKCEARFARKNKMVDDKFKKGKPRHGVLS